MEQRRQQQMPHPEEPRGGGDLHGGRRTAPPVLAEDEGAEGGGGARAHRSLLAKEAELGVDGLGKNGRRGRSRRGRFLGKPFHGLCEGTSGRGDALHSVEKPPFPRLAWARGREESRFPAWERGPLLGRGP
uniref:DUF834 domain-containing protein n=1 Tax=Oryza glumipatula TaxID=40148 RepID=A0A0E0BI47_9ORYZ